MMHTVDAETYSAIVRLRRRGFEISRYGKGKFLCAGAALSAQQVRDMADSKPRLRLKRQPPFEPTRQMVGKRENLKRLAKRWAECEGVINDAGSSQRVETCWCCPKT